MTIARDHGGKRKPSWESKISISTGSTRQVGRSDTPSSILSSDSDIRFTRKLGSQYRCGCCILAGFLCFLLIVAVVVYLAYTFILLQTSDERVFRVNFRITDGDAFSSALADPATDAFRKRARGYRERINLIFRRSTLRSAFLKTDILALDGHEGEDLIVHFNVHFDARRMPVQVPDLVQVLSHEITLQNPVYLSNLTIPLESLSIRESSLDMSTSLSTAATTTELPTTVNQPRICTSQQLSYCSRMGYNTSSYPNFLGHRNYDAVFEDVIQFREIVDSECYSHAYEFICYLLQPPCSGDDVKTPCRNFCNDFMRACGGRLSNLVKDSLDCSRFPETSTEATCIQKPGCMADLLASELSSRVCDGVVDCPDFSDEISCGYCPTGYLHCGSGKACVPGHKLCDGDVDCPDSSDEKNCLSLEPSTATPSIPQKHRLHDAGFVVALENGAVRKVCVDNLNATGENSLEKLANRVCRGASYAKVKSYDTEEDVDQRNPSTQYVEVEDLEVSRPLFLTTACQKRRILRVNCEDAVCGRQVLRSGHGVQGLPKMAAYGDWPWHVVLLKDGVHLCDGSLIAPDWIVSSASCFQGQSKAEWVAKIGGVVRVDSTSPWQQERLVVGLIKSPVEGSTLVLLNLNEPIVLTDYVRPVCLSEKSEDLSLCTTLGWSTTKKHLQRIDLKLSPMGLCENISITTINSLCTESPYATNDCQEEEFAGSPLLCPASDQKSWNLVGISNWRIGCQQPGIERPRMYDKLSSNVEWIRKTISA